MALRLNELVSIAARIIGIIMMAIGSTMVLNTALKFYVFGFTTPAYTDVDYLCSEKSFQIDTETDTPTQTKAECIAERTGVEQARYERSQKENIIDGGVAFIVGSALWFANRRRKTDT